MPPKPFGSRHLWSSWKAPRAGRSVGANLHLGLATAPEITALGVAVAVVGLVAGMSVEIPPPLSVGSVAELSPDFPAYLREVERCVGCTSPVFLRAEENTAVG